MDWDIRASMSNHYPGLTHLLSNVAEWDESSKLLVHWNLQSPKSTIAAATATATATATQI
ncbi:hypothetical protein BPOR_0015g00150 [Botrytis porri]|uniref:Uncharacterized protein n=1 Tax=Botrytis porri TaxID=87229 RepID=A0A4Z1L505_9HELO|nr:hypothetical protein BPOR_0015g00150 [Botrytis porri]